MDPGAAMATCPKCNTVRQPGDAQPLAQCPRCGVFYDKYRPKSAYQPVDQPVGFSGPRRKSSILPGALAVAVFLASGAYLWRDWLHARPALAVHAAADRMSKVAVKDRGQGLPGYAVSEEGDRAIARLLPGAQKVLGPIAQHERVVLFSTAWCDYCAQARKFLEAAQIKYADLDVERNIDAMHYHAKVLRAGGVPVIVIGNRIVFGYDERELRAALGEVASR
jgi:glutaredoxin